MLTVSNTPSHLGGVVARPVCRASSDHWVPVRALSTNTSRVCALRLSSLAGQAICLPGASFLTGATSLRLEQQPSNHRRAVQGRASSAVKVSALSMVWVALGAAVGGLVLGLVVAKAAQRYVEKEFDVSKASAENQALRAKVEELQQIVLKYQPMAYRGMRLRFTKGINKAVILGLVDSLLANKEVNIWWLPDSVERIFYFNVITLMLSVLDEVVEGMSMNLAGHNVKLQLSYLDMEQDTTAAAAAAAQEQQPGKMLPSAA